MIKESQIVWESDCKLFWVLKTRDAYVVVREGVFYSIDDSAYHKTADGLSIAIARAKYLSKRNKESEQ